MTFNDVMESSLLEFAKHLIASKKYDNKQVKEWIMDRFGPQGILRVIEWPVSGLFDPNENEMFVLRPYQLFRVNTFRYDHWYSAYVEQLADTSTDELFALLGSVQQLVNSNALAIWNLYGTGVDKDVPEAFCVTGNIVFTPGKIDALVDGHTLTISCSVVASLLECGALSFYGDVTNTAVPSNN